MSNSNSSLPLGLLNWEPTSQEDPHTHRPTGGHHLHTSLQIHSSTHLQRMSEVIQHFTHEFTYYSGGDLMDFNTF